ncbi:uncharacterized protein LOC141693297 [Apium graveolens]|uniref:uncharacterized protein LOC141693297 n=1 Tax=Apium graveolens TaxID=4045 RepID=UPI003D797E25
MGRMARNCKEPIQKANVLRITGPSPSAAPAAQPRARTFNMTMKDAVQNADVVVGMLDINSVKVKVLIEVANQEKVTSKRICPICDRIIEDRHFSADLILFKLREFDVLLWMDWFSNHYVQIKYRSKKVKLETNDGIEVIFKGKEQEKKFLMAIQTKRLLRHGGEAYLAHVKDVENEPLRIEDIPVVKDFPDEHPDELPGLPPDQEFKFMIYLAPGMESISKAPYRMPPVEIKELAT